MTAAYDELQRAAERVAAAGDPAEVELSGLVRRYAHHSWLDKPGTAESNLRAAVIQLRLGMEGSADPDVCEVAANARLLALANRRPGAV